MTLPRMAAILAACVFSLAASAQSNVWQPIAPADAQLVVPPAAFGTQGIQRWVIDTGTVRYERWGTPFDPYRRFFQMVLRQAAPGVVVVGDNDLRTIVLDNWGNHRTDLIRWGEERTVVTGLGTARVLPFQFQTFGCAGFHLPFGGVVAGMPVNVVQGLYCDPASARLPDQDIQGTLGSLGVAGAYNP